MFLVKSCGTETVQWLKTRLHLECCLKNWPGGRCLKGKCRQFSTPTGCVPSYPPGNRHLKGPWRCGWPAGQNAIAQHQPHLEANLGARGKGRGELSVTSVIPRWLQSHRNALQPANGWHLPSLPCPSVPSRALVPSARPTPTGQSLPVSHSKQCLYRVPSKSKCVCGLGRCPLSG